MKQRYETKQNEDGSHVKIDIPLKQGLKHLSVILLVCSASVKIDIPLKQGLKHLELETGRTIMRRVKIDIPLKQGLKQKSGKNADGCFRQLR